MGFSRQEYWSGLPFPSPGDLPDPGIEPGSPVLQADALTSEPPGKSKIFLWAPFFGGGKNTGMGCHSFLQEIFLTQGLNPGLPHYRQTLYCLSHQASYLKIKNIPRDNKGHYIMIKGSIQEEDITIENTYAPNIGAPQYIRQTLLNRHKRRNWQ